MDLSGGKPLRGGVKWEKRSVLGVLGVGTTAERRSLPELPKCGPKTKIKAVNVSMHGLATSDENIALLEKKQALRAVDDAKKAERAEARGKRKAAKRTAGEALWAEVTCGDKDLGDLSRDDLESLVVLKDCALPKNGKKNKPELKLALRDQFGTEITTADAGQRAPSDGDGDGAADQDDDTMMGSDDEAPGGPVGMDNDE